jgi:hypothetical protein
VAKNNKANNGKLEDHMEGYIADAESLKRTFIKSLSTYLKISMSDLAHKKNGSEDKFAPQIAGQAVPAPVKKQKILVEESEVQVPLKSNSRDFSLLSSSSSSSGSSSNLLKLKTTSSSSSTAAATATTATAGAGVSTIALSVIEKKAAKYCRETFRDLLSQVRTLIIPLPTLILCYDILPYLVIIYFYKYRTIAIN